MYRFTYFLLMIMAVGTNTMHAQNAKTKFGRIEHIPAFESNYIEARNVDVWLPENYDPKKKHAVLYMHDGQMLFDSAITWNQQDWGMDEVAQSLIDKNITKDCIVVGIWNIPDQRHSDYFPQKPFESLPWDFRDSLLTEVMRYGVSPLFAKEVQSDNYLKFIVYELKPYIDVKYPTLKDPANTCIMGSSMGGLISAYAICEYPEVFGAAACLSTHWPGVFDMDNNPVPDAFIAYLIKHLPDPATHRIYFDHGTETLDSLYPGTQIRVDEVMKNSGYSDSNWQTRVFEGAAHTEDDWKARLHIPLEFLLGN